MTQITLYKISKLGHFVTKDIELKPGKYTALGTRDGYRDVRQEFTVTAGNTKPIIVIQCKEKIANG